MKRLLFFFFALVATAAAPLFSAAQHIEGEVIVQLEKDYEINRFFSDAKAFPLIQAHPLSQRMNLWRVQFDSSLYSVPQITEGLSAFDRIVHVQKNRTGIEMRTGDKKIPGEQRVPNDPDFPVQWALDTAGSGRIDAPLAWARSTGGVTEKGDSIVIAVIDDGFFINHIDLNIFTNHNEIPGNGIDDDGNGYIDDHKGWNAHNNSPQVYEQPHGTHVAGIAGAKTDNGQGVAGVAWDAKILPVSVMSRYNPLTEADVLAAYGYVLEMRKQYNETDGEKGAYIVASNSSFGLDRADPGDYPLWCAFYDSLGQAGILNMGATTNSSVNVDDVGDVPSNCGSDHLLAVTNSSEAGSRAFMAGYGEENVDLAAPGSAIFSTTTSQGYGNNFGTSMAAPHVAGVVALMYGDMCEDLLSAYEGKPDSLALFVKQSLLNGVDYIPSLDGEVASKGKLNAYGALRQLHAFPCGETFIDETGIDTCGGCDAEVTFKAQNGFGTYVLEWSDGFVDSTLLNDSSCTRSGLCADQTYSVTVIDELGQEETETIEITGNDELYLRDWPEEESEPEAEDGELRVRAFGGTPPYTYHWKNGDTIPDLFDISAGEYILEVRDAMGCTVQDTFHLHITGIEQAEVESNVLIYPNPARDQLFVEQKDGVIRRVIIRDVAGKAVLTFGSDRERNTLDISSLASGVYFLDVETESDRVTRKIIVQ